LNSNQQIKDKFQEPIPIAIGTRSKPNHRPPAPITNNKNAKRTKISDGQQTSSSMLSSRSKFI